MRTSRFRSIIFVVTLTLTLCVLAEKAQARKRRNVVVPRKTESSHQLNFNSKDVTQSNERDEQGRRIVYRKRNVVDFDAMLLEGDIKNPNEFYFVHRPEEKFGTLVKKRPHFHKEMLRDAVMTR